MKLLLLLLVAYLSVADAKSKTPPTSLQIGVLKRIPDAYCLKKAAHGQSITVHYTGKLFSDGSVFDSSVTRGDPFTFNLGTRAVIQGWEQGVPGMCVGEKRKLIIPPEMGYGAQGSPPKIPANSHLVFEVELISINDATPRQMPPPHHQFGGQGMEFDEDGGEMYDAGTFDPQAHASQALRKMDAERKQQQQLEMEMPGHDDL